MAVITAGVLLLTALGLTAVGLVMNARFAASFGLTAEAAVLLAAIGLAVDLLAVVLPSVGVQFCTGGLSCPPARPGPSGSRCWR